ncbi:dihydroxy-acid dehydratase [Cellulosimicrobium cellulans]|uniref:dihydroxy-acid dehydratase n=1 Tax=Cellulosimicrobium cellulans TaxID=1710 RepID=UPI00130DBC64|nr:dihydroxy-acid dehydratase [Cellulosimicrobium cellulans]
MTLRSAGWFAGDDEVAVLHRVALRLGPEDAGRPVIGIADTASDLNPCNAGFTALAGHVAAGVRAAGGVPVRFPVMSLGEDLMKPSAMLYRNLVAMELEETVRAYPLDGVVHLANCDKTVPAALMAAASADVPALLLLGGARSAPEFRGRALGAGTDLWRALDDRRAGVLDDAGWRGLEQCLACAGPGACNVMGTASTLAMLTEAMGMALPGTALLDAVGPDIEAAARATGERLVAMVRADERPSARLTQAALDTAARVLAAVGGSTNAVIHLAAVAGRLGLDASLDRFDALWRDVPLLADVEPCGSGLVHRLRRDGGLPTVLAALGAGGLVDLDAVAGDGRAWRDVLPGHPAPGADGSLVRTLADPVLPAPTLAAVSGTLAPSGAVIKVAAASPDLLAHTGRAVVFDSYDDMRTRLDDPALDVDPGDVLVVRGCGPVGVPGMPEWGMAPIPQRLVESGVRDMVRVSDGRMSGTSFGTVVLHVAPEAAVGGPLGLVEDGDRVRLDVPARRLDLLVPEAELARRRSARGEAGPRAGARHLRGWPRLYADHVLQADRGADLDFLTAPTPAHRTFVEPVVGRS